MPKEQKKKHHYTSNTFALTPNTPGILISCNRSREARCISELRDLYNLFMELNDDSNASTNATHTSIEDSLKMEIRHLKKKSSSLEQVQLGDVKCLVFVKMADPILFVERLFKALPSLSFYPKFCQRLLPMHKVCYANFTELMKCSRDYLKEYMDNNTDSNDSSYAIIFESRLNNSLDRQTVTHAIADIVGTRWKVDLKHPNKVILIQVLKNVCGMSVIDNYYDKCKLNLQEFLSKKH